MRSISRAAAFSFGLIVSLIAVAMFATSGESVEPIRPKSVSPVRPSSQTIEVRYISWEWKEGYAAARFEIVNGLGRSVTYGAFAENAPFPTVKVNGESLNFMHCGTGQTKFSILSGKTVIFEVPAYYFDRVKPEDRVEVGFYFGSGRLGEAEHFSTEAFVLPVEFLDEAVRRH